MSLPSSKRGGAQMEYIILISASMLIAVDFSLGLGGTIEENFDRYRGTLASSHDRIAVARVTPESTSPGGETPETPAFAPYDLDCATYTDFATDFLPSKINVAAIVPGAWIGTIPPETFVHGASMTLGPITRMGGYNSRLLLGIEDDGDDRFSHGDRLSIYRLNRERVVNRALVRIDDDADIRSGDEHLVTHTKSLVLDIHGFSELPELRTYGLDAKSGASEFGTNDGMLDFIDLGCLINPDTSGNANDDDEPGDSENSPGNGSGNNGHGNDPDGNDDSNPGNSNDPDDDTDADGSPGQSSDNPAGDHPGSGKGKGKT